MERKVLVKLFDYLFGNCPNVIFYAVGFKSLCKFIFQVFLKVTLHTKDEENLNAIRLKFFDWTVKFFEIKTKNTLDNPSDICDNSRYQSSKILLSNGQKYSCKASWLQDKPGVDKGMPIIDCPEFWEEQDYIKIYNGEKEDGTEEKSRQQ